MAGKPGTPAGSYASTPGNGGWPIVAIAAPTLAEETVARALARTILTGITQDETTQAFCVQVAVIETLLQC